MSHQDDLRSEIDAQATAWVLRVHANDVRDEDIEALSEWQSKSDAHLEAYDRVERLWLSMEGQAQNESAAFVPEATISADIVDFASATQTRRPIAKPWYQSPWAAGVAASLLVALAIPGYLAFRPIPADVFETKRGETRELTLKDGSQIHLNSDTRLSVQMGRGERRLKLERGELALKVVHDADKPFRIEAGDQAIWDVGTQFNVLRHAGRLSVTVKEGAVSLTPASAKTMDMNSVLRAGDQAIVDEASGQVQRFKVDPDVSLAWEGGHVIYVDRPLSEVAIDLGRYFVKPLIVDNGAANLRLTAVIPLDSEASVVSRLQAFAPITARTSDEGIYLERRKGSRRPN